MIIDSTHIRNISYSRKAKELRVIFKNGNLYTYKDVPRSVFEKITKAESVGKKFNALVKGKFTFHKEEIMKKW